MANLGTATTPVVSTGAFVATTPDIHILVPSSVVAIPIAVSVKYEAIGTESEMEVVALASSIAAVATGTALTVQNLRMDAPIASLCTAFGEATVATGYSGNFAEFWRRGHNLADTPATTENDRHEHVYHWNIGDAGYAPVVAGGGSLAVWAASQAASGFYSIVWIELPASALS
jgi:hypothetical protein